MVWAPQSEAVVQQIAKGEFPFFDGKRAFGQPLFADPRSEVLYPPAWIHLIVSPDKSYALFSAFHLVIAALGAARLARRLRPDAHWSALLTAGIAYGAGGPILSLVSHWHHLAAAAWMPWILELAEPHPLRPVPWLGLSTVVALQVFAGSPDYMFTTLVLFVLRLATRTDVPLRERVRTFPAILLGLSIGAVQLLPSLAFARDAARDPLPIGWAISPLDPALTIETILPVRAETWPLRPEARSSLHLDDQVWMFSHYLGLSVWVLALLGLWRAERGERRFLFGCVLLGIGVAWGITDEFLQSAVARLPLVSGLRFPTKHLVASSLGLALLAAQGVVPSRTPVRVRAFGGGFLIAACAFAAVLFNWSTLSGPFEVRALAEPGVALVSAVCALLGASQLPGSLKWAPALVAVDLLVAHLSLNPTTPASFFRDRPPLSDAIPRGSRLYVSDYSITVRNGSIRLPPGRPYNLAKVPAGFTRNESVALAANWYLHPPTSGRHGYFGSFDLDILGFYRAPLRRSIEAFATSRDPRFLLESLQRGSVDYVITMDPPDLWGALPLVLEERRFFEDPVRVYRVPSPWPRARLETREGRLDGGSATIVSYSDARTVVDTRATGPTRLVLAVANDRGWLATVDGKSVSIVDNGLAFVSVPIQGGSHIVEFAYRPPLFTAGLIMSAVAAGAVLLLAIRAQRGEADRVQT